MGQIVKPRGDIIIYQRWSDIMAQLPEYWTKISYTCIRLSIANDNTKLAQQSISVLEKN